MALTLARSARSLLLVIAIVLAFAGCSKTKLPSNRLYVLTVAGQKEPAFTSETALSQEELRWLTQNLPPESSWTFEVWSRGFLSTRPGQANQLLKSASGQTTANLERMVAMVFKEQADLDGGK